MDKVKIKTFKNNDEYFKFLNKHKGKIRLVFLEIKGENIEIKYIQIP